jgi:hypothetical protein
MLWPTAGGIDPTRDLRGAISAPKVRPFSAILAPKRVGELLRAIDAYESMGIVRFALQFAPHASCGRANYATRNGKNSISTMPFGRSPPKRQDAQGTPRSIVAPDAGHSQDLRTLTGPSGHVFPSVRTRLRPMSENTMNAACAGLGADEMTAHGFRAMASTLLNESGKWNPDAIERALAHGEPDKVRGSYHRGKHWESVWPWRNGGAIISIACAMARKSCRFHPARLAEP